MKRTVYSHYKRGDLVVLTNEFQEKFFPGQKFVVENPIKKKKRTRYFITVREPVTDEVLSIPSDYLVLY